MKKIEKAVTVPNYRKEQIEALTKASPLDLESAKVIAESMGKSHRSVIAKVKSLGLVYNCKPAPQKKPSKTTKAELVSQISGYLDRDVTGLDKATSAALLAVINGIQHLMVGGLEAD